MPINATPLTLADNLFDDVALYPGHSVSVSGEQGGHEGYRAFDGLRDLTWWATPERVADEWVQVQCHVDRPADMVVLDRGHTLEGRTIVVEYGSDGVAWNVAFSGVVGQAGTTTAEGAWWASFAVQSAAWWRVRVPAGASAASLLVTGLWLGKSLRFKNYLHRPVDPDRTLLEYEERVTQGGVRVRSQFRALRELDDRLTLYNEAEYTEGVRKWVIQTTRGNVPFWWCLDTANAPEEMWQFLNNATQIAWAFETAKGRTGRIVAIENIPLRTLMYP
jgi:hypothetical protein